MRVAVAATAPFGADVLTRLAADLEIAFVLTRPDRPRGRGRRPGPPPAGQAAERLGIPVIQADRLTGDVTLDADTIVAVAYGLLVPEPLLERHLWLNVHPSLLPRWRGAAPVERAIMAGDDETGVTIIRLVKELDAGPIAAQRAFRIADDDDAGVVFARAAEVAVELLRDVLRRPSFRPQPCEGATYAHKITAEDRWIDWSRPPQEIVDRIRALSPHIGARGELHGREVIVWRARVADERVEPVDVQPAGGRRMTYDEFLRGLR